MSVNGILLLDKPQGISSNLALQKAKRLFNASKGGHTGNLDPIATGLLPLCFGNSTKISSMFLESNKSYLATIQLGATTTTGDREGKILQRYSVKTDETQIQQILKNFLGEYEQVPPMYSALKINGQPLYKLARRGINVERKARKVRVSVLELIAWKADIIKIFVSCSKGFYIRTLAEEIGKSLGCGGYVLQLRRIKCGSFDLKKAVTFKQIELIPLYKEREKLLISTDIALKFGKNDMN